MAERRFVVNASPLIFLAAIDALPLLSRLADQVLLPHAVLHEVILRAKRRAVIPAARPLVERLLGTGLYLERALVEAALAEVGE